MRNVEKFIAFALILICGIYIGTYQGDQATLKDCAIRGEARMFGGGHVTCTVQK